MIRKQRETPAHRKRVEDGPENFWGSAPTASAIAPQNSREKMLHGPPCPIGATAVPSRTHESASSGAGEGGIGIAPPIGAAGVPSNIIVRELEGFQQLQHKSRNKAIKRFEELSSTMGSERAKREVSLWIRKKVAPRGIDPPR